MRRRKYNGKTLSVPFGGDTCRLDKHNRSVGRGRWYQESDKSGRLLVRTIRTEHQPQPILEMRDEQGKFAHTQQAINKIFAAHLQRAFTDDLGVGAAA
ncbi:hypothetical protein NDU88_005725 [Pleurodeles waltl]|uniref:Uncharacterized protein n=1 Tax=Pleurodeles waltl TaxID=8319 RepID=A0AAV7SMH8_PLEWA|nr:hypothetical protein NDU88_005725 [Pleurodeles waltl]